MSEIESPVTIFLQRHPEAKILIMLGTSGNVFAEATLPMSPGIRGAWCAVGSTVEGALANLMNVLMTKEN